MLLLKNIRFLLTQNEDREVRENVDVLVKQDRVFKIGENLSDHHSSEKVLDCSNKVVLPGLINTHTHASMTAFRGISDNKLLEDWLHEDIFPAEDSLGEMDAYYGALTASVEMLKSGTTCFSDMYFHMEQVADAVEDSGIRAVLARGLTDIEEDQDLDKVIDQLVNLVGRDRIKPGIAPHSIYTCSENLLIDSKEIADKFNLLYHIHLSETEKENDDSVAARDMTPTEYLDNLGILDENTVAAHGTHLSQEDVNTLSENSVGVAHNPSANLKLGSGIADIPELRKKGVKVGLGTDGPASNNNLNLFEEGKISGLLHKRDDPRVINEQEILDMMTIEAAKILGIDDELGSVERAKKADLITIDLDSPEMRPFHGKKGIISNLIYSFSGNVSDAIVNGEIVVKDEGLVRADEEQVLRELQRRAEKFS
jgi:5-methylthioadenosine/S-adenosylhomocysteine deaminase